MRRAGVSAEVGEKDRLDRQSSDWTRLVPLLQLPGAHVARHQVNGSSVDDAAIFRPGLTGEAGVQARVRQPPLPRHATLQFGDQGSRGKCGQRRRDGEGRWQKLLGVAGAGGEGLRAQSPELVLGRRGGGRLGRLGRCEEILGFGSRRSGVRQTQERRSFRLYGVHLLFVCRLTHCQF